jgi:Kef-type K+ transport system membrane component KefB
MRLVLGLVLGFILGWIATAAIALTLGELMAVSQREGAFAMGAIFVMGPAGGIVGAVLGAWLLRRRRPR